MTEARHRPAFPGHWPDALCAHVAGRLAWLDEHLGALPEREALDDELALLAAASDYAIDWLGGHPDALTELLQRGLHRQAPNRSELESDLQRCMDLPAEDADEAPDGPLGRALRRYRNLHQVAVVWRIVTGRDGFDDTVRVLSDLAEVVIAAVLERLQAQAAARWGQPLDAGGRRQRLIVIAMGKLGARELNLSSDIDLIFAYPQAGTTTEPAPAGTLTHQEYFVRVARWLIGLLDTRTPQGFVFRVDARLRPFGDSGPLVQHAGALQAYYQEQGRDWERYAMIKARAVAGDPDAGRELLRSLRPFVYRRYLDFGAIEALREMKQMIRREVRRRRLHDDVKLGEGGIREVEFVAQVFQLIHGGRDLSLQQRSLRRVLTRLAETGALAAGEVAQLDAAYLYLRDVEHRLQMIGDEQTQRLPATELGRMRVAAGRGHEAWNGFEAELEEHRQQVAAIFTDLIAGPAEAEGDDELVAAWREIWQDPGDDDDARSLLSGAGFADAPMALRRIADLRARAGREVRQDIGWQRLDALMPRLLTVTARQAEPDRALLRVLPIVEEVLRRTAYLVLLLENPSALELLVRLGDASGMVAELLARHPILLDELLDPRRMHRTPEKAAMAAELAEQLRSIDAADLEAQMEQLRYFKEATELRVAACEIADVLPLMKVSDALTWLAETVVAEVARMAWQQTVEQYGRPRRDDGTPSEGDYLVIGYGKLGGLELGWGSDLDLVFLHDTPLTGTTDGTREVVNGQFFGRFGQRVIHMLTTRTHTGALYEVDIRLRPSGRSGMLVSSLASFADYQDSEAWIWEHQALVRARAVAGDPALAERFEVIRREILCRRRDVDALREEVARMRARMLAELAGLRQRPPAAALAGRRELDLKQAPGAIVDIEFMVQYLVLARACEHRELVRFSDNIRILEAARAVGVLAAEEAEFLIDSYREFRAEAHRRALENLPAQTDRPDLIERADRVAAIWDALMPAVPAP